MQKPCAMPHQTCKSQLSVFSTLIFHQAVAFLLLTHSHGGQAQTTLATVGGDVTLPCHVRPAADAVNQMLEWSRPDLNPKFVHVRRSGEVRLVDQNPSYEGRTSVSVDGLKRGDASLTLSKVRVTDEGTYRCFVPGLKTESNVQLVVVSGTVIEITKVSSGVLRCESRGWYPEPEVLWLDGEGNLLSAGPTETARGPDGFYTVSSRVTVEKRHSTSFTCRVQQRTTNQTRETHITVPGDFFSGSSGSRSSSSASTIIGLVVGFMFILVVAFVVWKWRQNKIKNVENHVDEETQRGGEKESNSNMNDSEQEPLIEGESDNREKLTAGREMKNQDMMEDKHHIDSEGTGRSCQSEEEKHQEKAGGQTNHIVTQRKNDRTEGETRKDLDDTEEQTKSINEETQAPPPEERDTHQEEPEDTNTEAAAQSQMVKEGIKPAGQASTDGEKGDLEETGGQRGESDATPCPTEREGQHEKNSAERETTKNSSRSEGTGCSCQNEEETHQEKAGGETENDLDNTEEETKPINEKTQDPPPEERDTHQEEPEDTNTEAAAQSQMDKEEIKPAGQGLTGEKDEVEETGGQTGESDATPCPTEREGQHEKNTERRDGALSRADGQTDLLPEVPNGLNKKDEDGKTESTSNEPTGEDARQRETQRHELQPEREEDTEEDNNMVTNEAEPPCSLKTETHTEQPEKRHDSRDGENGRKRIKDYTTPTDQPPADTTSDVENTEEETETNGDAQKRKEEGDRKSEREDKEKETNGGREGPTAED